MKTNYSNSPFDKLRVNRRGARWPLRFLLALALLALCLLAVLLWREALASLLWRIAAPVVAARNALSNGEVERLRAQLASTSAMLADRDFFYQ